MPTPADGPSAPGGGPPPVPSSASAAASTTASLPSVTVLGTGTMGAGMARSLHAAGLPVRVWNRTPERARPLADDGITVETDLAEAVRGAHVVITMLFDADSVAQTVEAAGDALAPGTVWLQTSTVGVAGCDRLVELASDRGLVLVDAPVLGTKGPAEQGALVVLASGPDDVRAVCTPSSTPSASARCGSDRPARARG